MKNCVVTKDRHPCVGGECPRWMRVCVFWQEGEPGLNFLGRIFLGEIWGFLCHSKKTFNLRSCKRGEVGYWVACYGACLELWWGDQDNGVAYEGCIMEDGWRDIALLGRQNSDSLYYTSSSCHRVSATLALLLHQRKLGLTQKVQTSFGPSQGSWTHSKKGADCPFLHTLAHRWPRLASVVLIGSGENNPIPPGHVGKVILVWKWRVCDFHSSVFNGI